MTLEETFRGRRTLVTGGLGFIGSNLAHRLVELGAQVLIVDALLPNQGGNWFNVHGIRDRVEVRTVDLRDMDTMAGLIQDQDYIFDLAGQVSHVDSMTNPLFDLELNVRSQLCLLETCRNLNPNVKIVHTATRQQYGVPERLPVDETHPLRPTDINGVHKTAGEMYFLVYHQAYGMKTTSLRLTNTYGPRQLIAHSRQGFIGWFIHKIMLGEEIQLFGDGTQVRDMCYVGDTVEAMLLAAASDRSNGESYNLGGPRPVMLKEIAELLIELKGSGSYRLVPFPLERKRIDIKNFYADISKIKQHLGWEPVTDLREGLSQTLAYYSQYLEYYLDLSA